MDSTIDTKNLSAEEEIFALARKHGVTYQPTALDELADAYARLSDNDVQLDEAGLLLLALERAGYITSAEANRLHGKHLRAKHKED